MFSWKIVASQFLFISSLGMAQATHNIFGTLPNGSIIDAYTLHSGDVELRVITFGARVVSLKTKDRNGRFGELALGYSSLDPYMNNKNTYFGATVGRYANRIAKGHLVLNGKFFQTTLNNKGVNTLHGGSEGFDRRNWKAKMVPGGVEFTLVSPDGDQGFPGTLTAHVRYTLHSNVVRIEYDATTDQSTVVNLTNHTYFNIAGEGSGSILGQRLTLYADSYTPIDAAMVPTGELASVLGTPYDFTRETIIGEHASQEIYEIASTFEVFRRRIPDGPCGSGNGHAVVRPTAGRGVTP
jgi:aldose 1-epimerase